MVWSSFFLPFKALGCLFNGRLFELDVLGHFTGNWLGMDTGLGIPFFVVAVVLLGGELMSTTGATGLLLALLLDSAACKQDVLVLVVGVDFISGELATGP